MNIIVVSGVNLGPICCPLTTSPQVLSLKVAVLLFRPVGPQCYTQLADDVVYPMSQGNGPARYKHEWSVAIRVYTCVD